MQNQTQTEPVTTGKNNQHPLTAKVRLNAFDVKVAVTATLPDGRTITIPTDGRLIPTEKGFVFLSTSGVVPGVYSIKTGKLLPCTEAGQYNSVLAELTANFNPESANSGMRGSAMVSAKGKTAKVSLDPEERILLAFCDENNETVQDGFKHWQDTLSTGILKVRTTGEYWIGFLPNGQKVRELPAWLEKYNPAGMGDTSDSETESVGVEA